MTYWEELDDLIAQHSLTAFTAEGLGTLVGQPTYRIGRLIQCHLVHQTSPWAISPVVLTRTGRTRAAVWHVGTRVADVKNLGKQTASDLRCRIQDFVEPTLTRIETLNPRAAATAQIALQALLYSAGQLESMLP
jgi:hypothetical protein